MDSARVLGAAQVIAIDTREIDPTRIITHTLPLDEAERGEHGGRMPPPHHLEEPTYSGRRGSLFAAASSATIRASCTRELIPSFQKTCRR
jgi:hypothetical protein